jgi:diguanylate cyclase (GGDEF)-like protein
VAADISSRTRGRIYASFAGLVVFAALVSAISVRDPDGVWLRIGAILMVAGAGLWLPAPAIAVLVPAVWLGPNVARYHLTDFDLFRADMLLELPGLAGLALSSLFAREQLRALEDETQARISFVGLDSELDPVTGVYQERLLGQSIERELVRSRRFGREFAVMLASVDPMVAKFDYRQDEKWEAGLKATAAVLLNTRTHIDRVYRYGDRAFALLLPETGPKDITGLIRRLSRAAKRSVPPEGEPGGPLPLNFGVTFFPQCATTVEDLLRRAEVAMRIAEKSPNRLQLDSAEAPGMPSPELMRRNEDEELYIDTLAAKWLGAEAPEEEQPAPPLAASSETASGRPAATGPVLPSGPDAAQPLAEMLARMDETMALIRSLKEQASA